MSTLPPERVVLVDSSDREVGTEEKLAAHQRGVLHRAFSVFVFDPSGRLLLQRRAAIKYHSAGLWSNSCCGHPSPGEKTIDAAGRRLGDLGSAHGCSVAWGAPPLPGGCPGRLGAR